MSTLLIFGPSGVGKTSLGVALEKHDGFRHIDFDVWQRDGVGDAALRAQWDALDLCHDPKPLAAEMARRVATKGQSGAVITLPSLVVMPERVLAAARAVGIQSVILYGPAENCLNAFLSRADTATRGLDFGHWLHNNASAYIQHGLSQYSDYRLQAFYRGQRRSLLALRKELKRRFL